MMMMMIQECMSIQMNPRSSRGVTEKCCISRGGFIGFIFQTNVP